MSAPIPPLDEAGLINLTDSRNLILAQIVARLTNDPDVLTPTELVQFANVVVNLGKMQIASHRAQTAAERTRLTAERIASRDPRYGKPTKREDDLEAPYGRKKDGTPYTPTEYRESLQEAVNEIYGVNLDDSLIHPERYTNNQTANTAPIRDPNPQSEIPNSQSLEPAYVSQTTPNDALANSTEIINQACASQASPNQPAPERAQPRTKSAISPPAFFRTDALPRPPNDRPPPAGPNRKIKENLR